MEFDLNFSGRGVGRRLETQPFRMLVLGNFGGQSAASEPLAGRRIAAVDFDSLEALWALFEPALQLDLGAARVTFQPRDLDDFHPDHLYLSLPVFAGLRATRKALLNPKTAQATLDELLSDHPPGPAAGPGSGDSEPPASGKGGDMFERLLGRPASAREKGPRPEQQARFEGFIRDIVAPHIVDDPDPRVETAIDSVDLAISELMRDLLHHPEFQALESSWRSLHDLVASLELDENLQLSACNVRREELLMGLPDPDTDLAGCDLFALLVNRNQARDDDPWTVIVSDETCRDSREDVALLTALGAAAAANGGIVLAAASPEILGCARVEDLAQPRSWSQAEEDSLWALLRESPVADRIGLALPRVLARLPYGADSDPIDRFEFEEMPRHDHAAYLWGNPAVHCARLLAENFTREGWGMAPEGHVDLGPLPAHTFVEDGQTRLKPCAEVLVPEAAMVAILEQGLMPLISYRDRNTAVLGRFQSIASPLKPLAGPWTG